jgi:hypothetical protein
MDATEFRERVETDTETQLRRLGSSQLLVGLTGAELTTEAVLDVAAGSEHAARETFREWAADEADDEVAAAFADVAEREDEHLERVLAAMPEDATFDPGDDPGPMHAYLRGRESTIERLAAGTVGRSLVSLRAHTQLISFFVNEADERRADLFRDLKSETEAGMERGLALLEARCGDEEWETARAAAGYVVRLAYDDYADAMAGLGLDVKVVC